MILTRFLRAGVNLNNRTRNPDLFCKQIRTLTHGHVQLTMEEKLKKYVKTLAPDEDEDEKPIPIMFVSGLMHDVKAWEKYWMPFFSGKGYECHAIGLHDTLLDTIKTMAAVTKTLCFPPIIVSHSLGTYVTYKYLESYPCSTAIFMNPLPPNHSGFEHIMSHIKSIDEDIFTKIINEKSFQPVLSNHSALKKLLFRSNFEDEKIEYFLREKFLCGHSLSLLADIKNLQAPRFEKDHGVPMMVVGSRFDEILDLDCVKETGAHFGLDIELNEDCMRWNDICGHSCVLDRDGLWNADIILEFLDSMGK
eukprot:c3341_g1_i1.p1 GENE.c3341_g1_i1~~c3341_g1_i1.p1  ORF type:complete len:306 (+),score=71.41 c3341_g1_i1:44-961(+)